MDYYYKLISKQDITRSFVINQKALVHFFRITLNTHGDESMIHLKYNNENFTPTRIVLHQDCRVLIQNRDFKMGQIAFFQRVGAAKFSLSIIKDEEKIKLIKRKLRNNYYISNTLIETHAN